MKHDDVKPFIGSRVRVAIGTKKVRKVFVGVLNYLTAEVSVEGGGTYRSIVYGGVLALMAERSDYLKAKPFPHTIYHRQPFQLSLKVYKMLSVDAV